MSANDTGWQDLVQTNNNPAQTPSPAQSQTPQTPQGQPSANDTGWQDMTPSTGASPAQQDAIQKTQGEATSGFWGTAAGVLPEGTEKVLSPLKKAIVDPFEKLKSAVSQVGRVGAEGLVQAVTPDLTPEETIAQHPVAIGVAHGAGEFAGELAGDPRNWPLMSGAAAKGLFGKMLTGAFASSMTAGAYATAKDLYDNWDKYTPEERSERATQGGLGTIFATLSALHLTGELKASVKGKAKAAIREKVTPKIEVSPRGAAIPVRQEGKIATAVHAGAPELTEQLAQTQTAPAVSKAVGGTVGEAVGSEAATTLAPEDRMGLKGHAKDLIENQARPAYQEMDKLSKAEADSHPAPSWSDYVKQNAGVPREELSANYKALKDANMTFSDIQEKMDNSRKDFTQEGRKAFKEAQQQKADMIAKYRYDLQDKGIDIDAADAAYRRGKAVEKMAKKIDTATGPSDVEGADYVLDGKKLMKVIDNGVRDGSWSTMGLSEEHVDELQSLAKIAAKQTEIPKVSFMAKSLGKLALLAAGLHGGMFTALQAVTGVSVADHISSKIANHVMQDAMMNYDATKAMREAVRTGDAQPVIDALAKDPSWVDRTKAYVRDTITKLKQGPSPAEGGPRLSQKLAPRDLPPMDAPPPDKGEFSAIKTDDGSLYWSKTPWHADIAKEKGVPPERITAGGFIKDGVYEETHRSEAAKLGERARTSLTQGKYYEWRTPRLSQDLAPGFSPKEIEDLKILGMPDKDVEGLWTSPEAKDTATNQQGEAMFYQNNPAGIEDTNMHHRVETRDAEGKVGELVAQDMKPGEITVRSNQIYDIEKQGKGRGSDQLRHFLANVDKSTHTVKSDISTTDQARGAWEKLVKENPDAISKKVYPDGQTQYSVDMDKYRELQGGKSSQASTQESAHPITQEHIEAAFPGQEIEKIDDRNFKVTLDNGNDIKIQLKDVVDGGGVEIQPGNAVFGRWDKLDDGGVMQLAGIAGEQTLRHETFHAAMDILPDRIKDALLEKYGDEEKAADAYGEYRPEAKTASLLGQVRDFFSQLYDKIFRPAQAAFRELHEGKVWDLANEKFIDSTPLRPDFSVKTYPKWEKDFRRTAAEQGATPQEIEKHIKVVAPAYTMFRELTNMPPDLPGSNVVDNAWEGKKTTFEYQGFCPKNKNYNPTKAGIEKSIGRFLNKQETIGLTLLMHSEALDAPCNYCYTLSGSAAVSENLGKTAREGTWVSASNVPETKLKLKTRETPDKPGTTQIFIPSVEERLLTDANYRQKQIAKDPELAQKVALQQWYADKKVYGNLKARKPMDEGIIPARGAMLRMSDEHIADINSRRGFRVSGNVDVTPYSYLDVAQDMADFRLRGAKRYSYTKQPTYVRLVGNTGEKINMSLTMDPRGTNFIANDWSDSMNINEARALRKDFPNAGGMLMALNDNHILAGLQSGDVDMMIPYHGTRTKFPAAVRDFVQDYSRENHETDIKTGQTVSGTKEIKQTEHNGDLATYLRLCKERGYLPKFARFIYDNVEFNKTANGVSSVHLKVDPETGVPEEPKLRKDTSKNFMKLVKDIARVDSPHEPIKQNVDMKILEQVISQIKTGTMPWQGEANPAIVQKAVERLKAGKPLYNGEMGFSYSPASEVPPSKLVTQIAPAPKTTTGPAPRATHTYSPKVGLKKINSEGKI